MDIYSGGAGLHLAHSAHLPSPLYVRTLGNCEVLSRVKICMSLMQKHKDMQVIAPVFKELAD